MVRFKVNVGVSNSHIHLSKTDYKKLFGTDPMVLVKELSQGDNFACRQKVNVDNKLDVRLVGPCRSYSQLELLSSQVHKFVEDIPVRESGDIDGAPLVKVMVGSKSVLVPAIIAQRHLHITPEDAEKYNLTQGQKVYAMYCGRRKTVYDNVIVRISDDAITELHIDIDEANAMGYKDGDQVEIITE